MGESESKGESNLRRPVSESDNQVWLTCLISLVSLQPFEFVYSNISQINVWSV